MKTKQELLEGLSNLLNGMQFQKVVSQEPKAWEREPSGNILTPKRMTSVLKNFIREYDVWPQSPRIIPVVTMGTKPGYVDLAFSDSFTDKEIETIDELWEKLTS